MKLPSWNIVKHAILVTTGVVLALTCKAPSEMAVKQFFVAFALGVTLICIWSAFHDFQRLCRSILLSVLLIWIVSHIGDETYRFTVKDPQGALVLSLAIIASLKIAQLSKSRILPKSDDREPTPVKREVTWL